MSEKSILHEHELNTQRATPRTQNAERKGKTPNTKHQTPNTKHQTLGEFPIGLDQPGQNAIRLDLLLPTLGTYVPYYQC